MALAMVEDDWDPDVALSVARELVLFLESLTDDRFLSEERFSDPWQEPR